MNVALAWLWYYVGCGLARLIDIRDEGRITAVLVDCYCAVMRWSFACQLRAGNRGPWQAIDWHDLKRNAS